jgi:Uma2 family endonuclease
MASAPLRARMSVELFRSFVEGRPDEERWELIDGVAVMMAPPTYVHQQIATNLQFLLFNALEIHAPALVVYQRGGINLGPSIQHYDPEPDVLVVDAEVTQELERRYADRFYLTAEIVSSSDRRRVESKRAIYKLHEPCKCILIVQQDRMEVQVDLRTEAGWTEQILRDLNEVLAIPAFGLRCMLSDLYRGTPLVPRQPRQESS